VPVVSAATPAVAVTPEELKGLSLPPWTLAYIEHGDDVQKINDMVAANGWRPGKQPFPSRSEPLLAAVGALGRAGVSRSEIKGILTDIRYGISASVLESNDPSKYADRQIKAALDKTPNHVILPSPPRTGHEADWVEVDRAGNPKPTYSNARAAIIALGIRCEKNLFTQRWLVAGHALGEITGELNDDVIAVLRQIII
jgi:hypothetical protein